MNKKWIKDFYNRLIEAEVSGDNSKVNRLLNDKKEHLPRYIYEYRSCNKYAFNDLFNNSIHLSHPTDFNDPLDCISVCTHEQAILISLLKPSVDEEDFLGFRKYFWSDDFCKIVKEKLLNGASYKNILIDRIQETGPFSKYEATNYYKQAKEELDNIVFKISNDYKNEVLLCSFSATVKNNLMWSHYAKSHTGFCVEYNLSSLSDSSILKTILFPVIYSKKPILSDINTVFYCGSPLKDIITMMNKSSDWSYEQEYRLFLSGINQDYRLSILPSRIYLGLNISERNQDKILKYAQKHNIEVRKMKLCASSFNLAHQRIY